MKLYVNAGRKAISLLLIIFMSLSLSACSGNEGNEGVDAGQSVESAENDTSEDEGVVAEPTSDDDSEENLLENQSETDQLSSTQRNSVNMLNYMSVLTQKVNAEKGNQLFLESAYSSLESDIYPNAVDTKTQTQIMGLLDTINAYRMIAVKRDRLKYIYEQNRASALRQAIPDPIGLLSVVKSGDILKAAVSVLYMAADSVSSYQNAVSQADRQFVQDGWELDDEESEELHNSTKSQLSYMLNIVRDYDLPGDYALNKESIEKFVTWSGKPDSQLAGKIKWLESNQDTYKAFGPYWLELSKDYYNNGDYKKSLEAIKQYESVSTRIFRKDINYASALPAAIVAAKETMNEADYIKRAEKYCTEIMENTKDTDWSLRYYVAQTYLDLFSITEDSRYIDEAYNIAFDNVNVLVDEQKKLNSNYKSDIQPVKESKDATKREKKEIKAYNKLMKEERKIALPPVNEALYLNCELMFALAKEKGIDTSEQKKIESILHENSNPIFLTNVVDDRFWFDNPAKGIDLRKVDIQFDGDEISIPASCVSDRSLIQVRVGDTVIEDWEIDKVDRPKKAKDPSEYIATYKSEVGDDYKYKSGDKVTVRIITVDASPEKYIDFTFNAISTKKAVVIKDVEFERAN